MLKAQLAASTSLNAALLNPKAGYRHVESYLFSTQQAAAHDLDSLHALATNALNFLSTTSNNDIISISKCPLFAPSAAATTAFKDRSFLTPEENASIDTLVENVLLTVSPWLLEQAGGSILEWLVRRWRCASPSFSFSFSSIASQNT